jgi:ribonuclease BN (tRNA processing enzyme)
MPHRSPMPTRCTASTPTPEIINRNIDLLDIDPSRIDGLSPSHAHHDHFGGLVGFVTQHRKRMRDDLAFYVGGEESFREKWLGEPSNPVSWGTLDDDAHGTEGDPGVLPRAARARTRVHARLHRAQLVRDGQRRVDGL